MLDGTSFAMPVHHGYNPAFGRAKGVATDALSMRNLELTGGTSRIEHIKSSTHRLGKRGWVYPNVFCYPLALKRVWVPQIVRFVLYDLVASVACVSRYYAADFAVCLDFGRVGHDWLPL